MKHTTQGRTRYPMARPVRARCVSGPLLALLSLPAMAHVPQGAGLSGFLAGLLHPVLGLDHLLAMIAVGVWGAVLGRPLLWALPVAFPLLMLAGAALGMFGVPLAGVEAGIALSVVVLGLATALAWRAPVALALAVVAAFGLFHGHAHGTELPQSADPAAYAAGFVLETGLLHLAGVAIGSLWRLAAGRALVRAAGAAVCGAGLWLLAGAAGVVG